MVGFPLFLTLGGGLWMTVFFFNDTATTEIYPLSLHDALPIWTESSTFEDAGKLIPAFILVVAFVSATQVMPLREDRMSTRLNSSHQVISYTVFSFHTKDNFLTITSVVSRCLVAAPSSLPAPPHRVT